MLIGANDHKSECPTCHQQTQLRKLTLSKAFIAPLKVAVEKGGTFTSKDVLDSLGNTAYANFTALKHWEFIEEVDSATWRITQLGKEFVVGKVEVPQILWVYNDKARFVNEDMYGEIVSVHDLIERKEMSRERAAAESVPLDVSGQERIL